MQIINTVAIASVIASAAASKIQVGDDAPLNLAITADKINAMKTTWTAGVPSRFANATIADAKRMLGTVMPHESGYEAPEVEKVTFTTTGSIPTDFDARTAFPNCANIIGHVRDQSDCGSCWAFGSTEAFNDRHCISTGDSKTLFAPEDTVSCCSGLNCAMSMGCNGGQPSGAWKWFIKSGVSTGGDWGDIGTGTSCKPYSMQTCAHHVTPPPGMIACDTLEEYATPKCTSSCNEATYPIPYAKDKAFAKTTYSVKGEENMQRELMEKGTLSVAFTVYEDFEAYSSGVYQHKTGRSLVVMLKMIGWGVDNGTPYWTCINSWNDSWGEGGAFRILRGENECGIEGSVVAGEV